MALDYSSEANVKKKKLSGHHTQKSKGEDDDEDECIMSPLIAHYLLSYFKNDGTVSACRTYIDRQVFEGMYKMVIEVGLANAGQNEQPPFFNDEAFLEPLRAFFSDAGAAIYVMKAVPLWYYTDPASWLRKYMNSTSTRERTDLGLPFGVMDLTKCYIKAVNNGMNRSFQVLPAKEGGKPNVSYTLFNVGMEIIDMDPDVLKEAELFYNRMDKKTRQRIDIMTNAPYIGMPSSTFYSLAVDKKHLDRAELCQRHANFVRSHPLALFTSEPPPTLPGAVSMSESLLLGGGDINESDLAMRQRLSAMMNERARHTVQRIKEEVNGGQAPYVNAEGLTRRAALKKEFETMDALDDAFVFDDSIRVGKVDPADVIIDPTVLKKIYTENIYQQMGLPNDMFVSQRALDYRSNKSSQTSLFSNAISDMFTDPIHQRAIIDQRLYSKLFAHVATAPFDLYHMDKIIAMIEENDRHVDHLMNEVRMVTSARLRAYMDMEVIYRATPAMLLQQIKGMLRETKDDKPTPNEGAASDAMEVDVAAHKEELKVVMAKVKVALKVVNSLRVESQGLNYYMLGLKSHNPAKQSIARLHFEEREEYLAAKEEEKEMIELEKAPAKPAKPPALPKKKKPAKEKAEKKKAKKPAAEKKQEKPAKKKKKKTEPVEANPKKRKREEGGGGEGSDNEKPKKKKQKTDKDEKGKKKKEEEEEEDSESKTEDKKDDDESEEDSDDDESDEAEEKKKPKKKKITKKD